MCLVSIISKGIRYGLDNYAHDDVDDIVATEKTVEGKVVHVLSTPF